MVSDLKQCAKSLLTAVTLTSALVVFIINDASVRNILRGPPPTPISKTKTLDQITRHSKLIYKGEFNETINTAMSTDIADTIYYNFMFHQHYSCEDNVRMGLATDGGWDVCLAGPFRPGTSCLVYSFGINNEFSFDDAMSSTFNCTVRAFDPSMNVENHRRGPNIWFYKTGLGLSNENNSATMNGWRMRNFVTLVEELGDKDKTVDYLKIDIESSEWASLESMFQTDVLQSRVKQLAIEIHLMPIGTVDIGEFYRRWKMMKHIEEIGFKRWYWHFNTFGAYDYIGRRRSCCYEMVYINTAFLTRPPASSAAQRYGAWLGQLWLSVCLFVYLSLASTTAVKPIGYYIGQSM